MVRSRTLRGLAIEQFGSLVKFAQALGWSYSKTNRIVNGSREPNAGEMRAMARVLGIESPDEMVSVFSLH